MKTTALAQARLDELNEALAVEVRSTRDVVKAARRLGGTVLAGRGDTWLYQFEDGRARLWRATAKDQDGGLDELDGFDGAIEGFGHKHVCLNCQAVIQDEVFDCQAEYDHAFELCEDCLRAGVRPMDVDKDVALIESDGRLEKA